MTVYQLEQQIVEAEVKWEDLQRYAETALSNEQIHQVEENLHRMLIGLGRSLLQRSVEAAALAEGKKSIEEDDEGNLLPFNSIKQRKYVSIFGPIRIERRYYWKFGAKGCCPLDKKLNLPERCYSYLLSKWVQSGVAEGPFDQALKHINDILNVDVPKRSQEAISQDIGTYAERFYEQCEVPDAESEGAVIGVTADCKGVPMVPAEQPVEAKAKKVRRGKGDKKKGLRRDAVVTADYSFNPAPRTPSEMIKLLMRSASEEERATYKQEQAMRKASKEPEPRKPLNKMVSACMNGKEEAFRLLADRVARRDPTGRKPIYIQIDGEKALENRLREEFERRGWNDRIAGCCLDIFHVMEYVWSAANALFGEKSKDREAWVEKQGLSLLEGRVGRVIGALRQILTKREGLSKSRRETLTKVINYFENHRHMMMYDKYLAAGYPIGTGVAEGTCGSLVKDRTENAGMKWTKQGAQCVLDLRALKRNGLWDSFWGFVIEQEATRLYDPHQRLQASIEPISPK